MKAKLNYRTKRILILSAVIIALLAVATVGVTYYLKGNNRTQAATGEEVESQSNPETQQLNGETNLTESTESNEGIIPETTENIENGRENNSAQNNNKNPNDGATTNNAGNAKTTVIATSTDTNATEAIDYEEIEKRTENFVYGWKEDEIKLASTATIENLSINKYKVNVKIEQISEPKEKYDFGDVISYKITVSNDGNVKIEGISINNKINGEPVTIVNRVDEDGNIIEENINLEDYKLDLEPGEEAYFIYDYTVTEQDIVDGNDEEDGTIKNVIEVIADKTETKEVIEIPTEEIRKALTVTKTVTNPLEDGEKYALGDLITFDVVIENTGNVTIHNIEVEEKLDSARLVDNIELPISQLEPKQSIVLKYEYDVEEENIGNTNFTNKIVVKSVEDEIETSAETKTIPVDEKNPNLTILKTALTNKEKVTVGDTIDYTITIENTGNITLNDITVKDITLEEEWNNITLAPGQKEIINFTHIIEPKDITLDESGKAVIVNKARFECDQITNVDPTNPVDDDTENKIENVEDMYGYTINYYYEGYSAPETVAGEPVKLGTSTDDLNINTTPKAGYKLRETDPIIKPATISADEDANVINVYYVKDDSQTKTIGYTVEYYTGTIKVDTDTITVNKEVWVNDPDILTVETFDKSNDKYIGYKLGSTDPETIPTEVTTGTIIKVNYIKDDSQTKTIGYTIEYYTETTKVDADTITVNKEVWVNDPDILTVQEVNKANNKYTGYKYDHTEPAQIPETIADGGEIKVYYIKDDTQTHTVTCTIRYYLNERPEGPSTKIVSKEVWAGSNEITLDASDVFKTFEGYKFDKIVIDATVYDACPINVTEGKIVNVYYIMDDDATHRLSYTVEYYKNNVKVEGDDRTFTQEEWAGTNQVTLDANNIETSKYAGYDYQGIKVGDSEELTTTIPDKVTDDSTIKVYYVKNENLKHTLTYTVEYYKENIKVDGDGGTYQVSVWAGTNQVPVDASKIETSKYVGYAYKGIKVGSDNTLTNTIPANVISGTKIKVYYEKNLNDTRNISYIVKYYKDGVEAASETKTKAVWAGTNEIPVESGDINTTNKFNGYVFENLKVGSGNTTTTKPTKVNKDETVHVYYKAKYNLSITKKEHRREHIIIIADFSESTRDYINKEKEVIVNFINKFYIENKRDITVIRYSLSEAALVASTRNVSKSTAINKVENEKELYGATDIKAALEWLTYKTLITQKYTHQIECKFDKNDKNIVIFMGDGFDTLYDTLVIEENAIANIRKNDIYNAAEKLKNLVDVVHTIGVDMITSAGWRHGAYYTSGEVRVANELMTSKIKSNNGYFFSSVSDAESSNSISNKLEELMDLTHSTVNDSTTEKEYLLSGLNDSYNAIINGTEINPKSNDGKIFKRDGKYYLNLTKFDSTQTINIEYYIN